MTNSWMFILRSQVRRLARRSRLGSRRARAYLILRARVRVQMRVRATLGACRPRRVRPGNGLVPRHPIGQLAARELALDNRHQLEVDLARRKYEYEQFSARQRYAVC